MDDKIREKSTQRIKRAKERTELWEKAIAACRDEAEVQKLYKFAEKMRRHSIYARGYRRAWIGLGLGSHEIN
jgi:tRNA A37 N6-isopentenylltransferase MiaA